MLDPIITILGAWYQTPLCLPPLDADPGTGGHQSDLLIPIMKPVNMVNKKPARSHRQLKVGPLPKSVLTKIRLILQEKDWSCVLNAKTANEKADLFHNKIMEVIDDVAP